MYAPESAHLQQPALLSTSTAHTHTHVLRGSLSAHACNGSLNEKLLRGVKCPRSPNPVFPLEEEFVSVTTQAFLTRFFAPGIVSSPLDEQAFLTSIREVRGVSKRASRAEMLDSNMACRTRFSSLVHAQSTLHASESHC